MPLDDVVENFFAEVALDDGLCDEAALQRCRETQDRLIGVGTERRLGEIMMAEGLITKAQALAALKKAHKKRGDKPRIGGYELLTKLGQGGMGVVYKAKQVSMDREVALKLLPRKLSKDEGFVERFMREARTSAKLNHPNIVTAIDVGQAQGYHYFAMEYVDGEPLDDTMEREGRLQETVAIDYAMQVLAGLEHAAQAGITHRDIKPGNLMLCKDGTVKITDMGLAVAGREGGSAGDEGEDGSITGHDKRAGTPYYMAPEQVEGQHELDWRADQYALGASLFEMVTGKKPFDGANAQAIMAMRLYEDPPDAYTVHKGVGKGFAAVLKKMMAREPDGRYLDFDTLIEDLERVLSGKRPSYAKVAKAPKRTKEAAAKSTSHAGGKRKLGGRQSHSTQQNLVIALCGIVFLVAVVFLMGVVLMWEQFRGPVHPDPSQREIGWSLPDVPEGEGDRLRALWVVARDEFHRFQRSGGTSDRQRRAVERAFRAVIDQSPEDGAYRRPAQEVLDQLAPTAQR